jgi:hypothetical protein
MYCTISYLCPIKPNEKTNTKERGIIVTSVDKNVYFLSELTAMYKEHFMHANMPCHNAIHFV